MSIKKNCEYILDTGGKYDIHPCVAATQTFISRTKMSDTHAKNDIPRNFIQKAVHLMVFLEKLVREEN